MLNLDLLDELCRPREGTPADMAENAEGLRKIEPSENQDDSTNLWNAEGLPKNGEARDQEDSSNFRNAENPQCATQEQETETDTRPCSEGGTVSSSPGDTETAPSLKYVRRHGESLNDYLRRNQANIYLAGILASGIDDERQIVEETRKGYTYQWEGVKLYFGEKYYNSPEVRRRRERDFAVIDGALLTEAPAV